MLKGPKKHKALVKKGHIVDRDAARRTDPGVRFEKEVNSKEEKSAS